MQASAAASSSTVGAADQLCLPVISAAVSAAIPPTSVAAPAKSALRRWGELDSASRPAHWCTIVVSVILDGSLMHPRCRQAIALLA